jgi:hypothetical protein
MDFTLTQAQDDLGALTRQILADQLTRERRRETADTGFDSAA